MKLNRRGFIASATAASAFLPAPLLHARGRPRVVVIGGGATAARDIARDAGGAWM